MPLGTGATNPSISTPRIPSLAWGGKGIGNVDAAKPPTRNSILGGLNATPIAQFKTGPRLNTMPMAGFRPTPHMPMPMPNTLHPPIGVVPMPTTTPLPIMQHHLPLDLHGMVARIQSLSPAARLSLFRAFGGAR